MARGFKPNPKRRVESEILPGQKESITTEAPRIVMGKQMEQTDTHITIVEEIVHTHTHKRADITDFFATPFYSNIPDRAHNHAPNEISPQGHNSGLNADLLDGQHASAFAAANHTHTPSSISPQGHNSGLNADMVDGDHASAFERITNKGQPNGYAPLDSTGKVPLDRIPAGVDAGKLQGRNVAATAPVDGQVLKWNASANQWEPGTIANGGGQLGVCATIPPTTIAPGAQVVIAKFLVPVMQSRIRVLAIAFGPSEVTYDVVTLALKNEATGQIIASWGVAGDQGTFYDEPQTTYDLGGYEGSPVSFVLYHSSDYALTCWASVFFKFIRTE